MTIKRWLIATVACCVFAAGRSQAPQGNAAKHASQPPPAGRGTNPLLTVGQLAGIGRISVSVNEPVFLDGGHIKGSM